jgi:phosphonate transport system substrate-binding protein
VKTSMSVSKSIMALVLLMIIPCAVAVSSPCSAGAESPRTKEYYTFAIIPQGPPEAMHRNWSPFIDLLSRDTGLALRLKVYEQMADFEEDLKEGSVDFAYMNPVQEVMAWNAQGYIPLVKSKNLITGCIFVRKDSGIKELHDLEGKEIALVGLKNVCSIVIRHDLRALNVGSRFVGSTSNVYKHVEIGDTAAGGSLDIVLEKDALEVNREFHTIYATEPLSSHPISVHPSVPADARHSVMAAVLKYREDKDSRGLLEQIGMKDPVTADYDKDYKPLEQKLMGSSETGR